MKARLKTKAKAIGRRDFVTSMKSFEPAVMPVTATSAPGSLPTVAGTSRAAPPPTRWTQRRCLDLWGGDVLGLDDDLGGHAATGERRLDAVVGIHDRQAVARVAV